MKRLLPFIFLCAVVSAQTNRFPPINLYTGDPTGVACTVANSIVQSTTNGGFYSCVGGFYVTAVIDPTRVSKSGDTMTGPLTLTGAKPGAYFKADGSGSGYPSANEAFLTPPFSYPPNLLTQYTPQPVTNGTFSFVGQMWAYPNGILGTAYFQSDSATAGFWNGPVHYRTSSDGGQTWGSPATLPFTCHFTTTSDSGGTGCINVSGGITPSGRVVLFTMSTFTSTHYIYSDNHGATWSSEASITWPVTVGGVATTQCSMHGKIIPIANGKLMQAGFCYSNGGTFESVAFFSTDDGLTWGGMTVIASHAEPEEPDEPSCAYFGASQIVCMLRWNGSAQTGPLQMFSNNNGASFTSQGFASFDPAIVGGADVSYPFDLETFIDIDGKMSAILFYYQRIGSDGGKNLKVVTADPNLLIALGPSAWNAQSLTTIYSDAATGTPLSGYPTTVGNGRGYFLGWFFQVPAAGPGYMRFFSYSGAGARGVSGTLAQLGISNALAHPVNIKRFVDGSAGPIVSLGHSRGTPGSPSDVSSTDELGEYNFGAYLASNYVDFAGISSTLEGVSGSAANARMAFTVSNTSVGVFEAARINSAGHLLLGTTTECGAHLCTPGGIEVNSIKINSGGSSGKAICWKTASTLGYCSTQPDANGACTCN